MARNLLDVGDLSCIDLDSILAAASRPTGEFRRVLEGKGAALVFEKPSLRTRNSTELAVVALGGHPVYMQADEVGIGVREELEDIARVLGAYHAVICARVIRHETLERMVAVLDAGGNDGENSSVPVVNLLSDLAHPCQAIADMLTVRQAFGDCGGRILAYIGDANNVFRSLMQAAAMMGMTLRCASPEGYGPRDDDVALIAGRGGELEIYSEPGDAVAGADVIYTDTWVSMGDEHEADVRRKVFAGYTVDDKMLELASRDAIVMHCLPAHRGEEITHSVLCGSKSAAWKQAANRLPATTSVLAWVTGAEGLEG
ncbi:MAG: ornithine carbamoyltransferase [Actinobacteria bacterium]|nr:ornithine carbamoyltransferase [Actinomycetota bacterium]MCL5446178.1 ornithine carbamoyltransferase [Actinomycetota bacterium]